MAKEAFPRHEDSGLVDLDCYLPFLPDPPDRVPAFVRPSPDAPFVHQHVYFTWGKYRSPGKTADEGQDNPLAKFRAFSYNQVLMRRRKELKLHQKYEDEVEHPPMSTVSASLEDLREIDMLAASAIGFEVSRNPEVIAMHVPEMGEPKAYQVVPRTEISDFFETQREKLIEVLRSPRITPQSVVVSALKRVATYLDNPRLDKEANERLAADHIYFPVRVRSLRHYYDLGNSMLNQEFGILEAREETEVDSAEEAA